MAKTRRAPEEDVRRRPDDEDEAPRQARRDDDSDEPEDDEPLRPRKKRQSAKGPVKLIVRIVGGVVGAVVLFILLYWIYSPVGTDHSMLCYFPPQTTSLSGYDVADGTANAKFKEVHDLLINNYKNFASRRFSESGVSEKDALNYMTGQVTGNPDEEKDLPPQEKRGSITVVRFRKDVDQTRFINSFTGALKAEERTSRDGRKYHHLYRLNGADREEDISFFFPTARTLVYATTWRELEECMTRQPGRVVVEGDMRELANKVDGTYYTASGGWAEYNDQPNAMAFGLGFVDPEVRDQKTYSGRTGTAMWLADNGNDFLFASAVLYSDVRTARDVRNKVKASFRKAQAEIYQNEGGKPGGLEDPFSPKPKDAQGAFGGGGPNEQLKDILAGLSEYAKTARVYNRGRLVIVEGTISHGTPEQGVFEKFWKAIQGKFSNQRQQGPGGNMMPGMGMPGMPGGGGPPMPGAPPR